MIELTLRDLEIVSGGGKTGAAVRDDAISNVSSAAGEGRASWGALAGGLTSAAIIGATRANAVVLTTVVPASRSYVHRKYDEAVNAPPYNGRPIFEIEHGLTGPNSNNKAGTDY